MPTAASEAPRKTSPTSSKPERRSLPKTGVWVTLAGVCILVGTSVVIHWPPGTAATAAEPVAPVVGAWTDGGEEWLVLEPGGTGARTRPDPTWGNRRYTFRWRAEGGALRMTEQRVSLPGGSQATAGDASENFSVSSDGKSLTLGTQKFSRHKP